MAAIVILKRTIKSNQDIEDSNEEATMPQQNDQMEQ